MKRNKTEFAILPAFQGDCILIKTFDINNNEFIILIDGGTAQTFKFSLKKELKVISHIDILILTHIDSDHIAGLIKLFKSSFIDRIIIDEIWMNHPEFVEVDGDELISTKQGNNLKDLIIAKKPDARLLRVSTREKSIIRSGIEFTLLSPTPCIENQLYQQWQLFDLTRKKKDINISTYQITHFRPLEELSKIPFTPDKAIKDDIFNSSSIAFILKCHDVSILLLADSRPEVISKGLRLNGFSESDPLIVDYVKISHHGSLNNTSQEQLSLIKCKNFIISTNGGTSAYQHPSRETIARIIHNSQRNHESIHIYFNYQIEYLKERIGNFINANDFKEGNWQAEYKNWF